jgi:hypothetical protein
MVFALNAVLDINIPNFLNGLRMRNNPHIAMRLRCIGHPAGIFLFLRFCFLLERL